MKGSSPSRFKTPPFAKALSRAQQVGGLSLTALLVGGTILILFSVNIITSHQVYRSGQGGGVNGATMVVFRFGSQLGVQAWLAVLGVAFGLLSFGMNETFTHLFDSWSSSRANKRPGLNYARYLNSQPQSPILVGRRGFWFAILLRNVVLALGIVASAGYSFAVVDVVVDIYQHLDPSLVRLGLPPVSGLLESGIASPWVGDLPGASRNRAFLHLQRYSNQPLPSAPFSLPKRIVMTGWANCSDTFNGLDDGVLYTREIVLVADKTRDWGWNHILMDGNALGWTRLENASSKWTLTNGTHQGQAVVDYRVSKPGQLEIKWAKMGNWLRNSSETEPAIRTVAYDIQHAVAIVRRFVSGRDCADITDRDGALLAGQIVTTANISRKFENHPESRCFNMNWVKPILLNEDSGPLEGVSGLVRGAMACWAADGPFSQNQNGMPQLGHAPEGFPPRPQANLSAKYPVYAGKRLTGQSGSYQSIIYLFISLGLFAYILIAYRMYLGPAELTSWMGQHVYLAGLGGKVPKEATDHLADGHRAAMESKLGRVRIKADEPLRRPLERYEYYELPNLPADYGLYSGRWVNNL
ncbi:hypothetical protein QBC37DRAFT_300635 [Rhypophila decipiens]|uniref:Uncharacterized protein n=1 Tax=Rhypophila decipiens TaxID=261697 RepID=A0AAN7B175_9PEZI|nr:hypothetical protein QBC37DRAFT_300635 [Rhypophila decipiens]